MFVQDGFLYLIVTRHKLTVKLWTVPEKEKSLSSKAVWPDGPLTNMTLSL
jgi:hypothetical protein